MLREVVHARGHENVTARHTSTFEVTSDDYLTPAGDCILAVEADRTPADFDEAFVTACQRAETTVAVEIAVGETTERVEGRGHPELGFDSNRSLVCRTSDYVDERTVGVGMDRAAAGIDRAVVDRLAAGASLELTLTAHP
jgi:hypothetical protein